MKPPIKSNISIPVEIAAGTSVINAIGEAREKARIWDVQYVTFNFNGTPMSIGQHANIKNALSQFDNPEMKFVVES